ncbi:MAG: Pre-rRNA-processing protein ipi3 [Trizodia sp. TS-e1964]|nr:MAG: Pre-rRNA-processing protein ipi3 [Trizodia sp. TS-e1964]
MLSESFVASTSSIEKAGSSRISKDIGIHIYNLQPSIKANSVFKKSSTPQSCLALSSTHIFAAQIEKSVVHVYSIEKGNIECIVPFPERIVSLAFSCNGNNGDGVLILGTDKGRLILWEVATGRQISTPQSHLQAVTALAISPSSSYLVSGSRDSNVHIWSLPSLLSFVSSSQSENIDSTSISPQHVLTNHRASITSVTTGHGLDISNIAVSAAMDNTCIVWNYYTGVLLRTFLFSSSPLCLAIDPCDRGCYAGFEDGSIQMIDFFDNRQSFNENLQSENPLYNTSLQPIPVQILDSDRWIPPQPDIGTALAVSLSYDGTLLFSAHRSGKIISWDISRGTFNKNIVDLELPVSNLLVQPPTGFLNSKPPLNKLHNVVKPKYEAALGVKTGDIVPADYTFSIQFLKPMPPVFFSAEEVFSSESLFDQALRHPSFPLEILEAGICELASLRISPTSNPNGQPNSTTEADVDELDEDTEMQDAETETNPKSSEIKKLKREKAELHRLLVQSRKSEKKIWHNYCKVRFEAIESRRLKDNQKRGLRARAKQSDSGNGASAKTEGASISIVGSDYDDDSGNFDSAREGDVETLRLENMKTN